MKILIYAGYKIIKIIRKAKEKEKHLPTYPTRFRGINDCLLVSRSIKCFALTFGLVKWLFFPWSLHKQIK
jgi:hypothetical protein